MKAIIKLIFLLSITSVACAQNNPIEGLMTRRFISCQDITYNVQYLIPELYKKHALDTIRAVIDYWEANCGESEQSTRCKILFSIERGDFKENLYGERILDYLLSYKKYHSDSESKYQYVIVSNGWRYNNKIDTLDRFTAQLTKELLSRNDLDTIEIFFLRMYSDQFEGAFKMLEDEEFDGTIIQELYLNEIKRFEESTVGHLDFMTGIWVPDQNLKIVGNHPFLGVRGGFKHKKFILDGTLGFKFVRAPNMYQVYENDSVWDTNHFFGGYLGLDAGMEMFRLKKSSFDLIGGIAFDGFDALDIKEGSSNLDVSKSLNSFNANIGLGYKFYISRSGYVGVDVKYNIVNYKNTFGTDLTGNVFTINLIYGFISNYYEVGRLDLLDYY